MKSNINKQLGKILIVLMSVMTIDVLWGVFTRYVVGTQASWTEELARFLLIWIGLLGAAYASGEKMHLSIDLLQPKLSDEQHKIVQKLINLIIIIFVLGVLVIGGIRLIYVTKVLGQISPALQLPMSLVYSVLPISGLLIIYFKITDLFFNKQNN